MRRILEILTPENVNVEYELSGLGSRFAALLLDHLIQFGMLAVVAIGMLIGGVNLEKLTELNESYNSLVIAAGLILIFIIMSGYFIFFEMTMNGQTPGKRVMKLRVIKQNGEPINFYDSFLRNVLRTADMLPSLYLVGAAFILFTRNYKRIGDFAANTVVVKVKKGEQPITIDGLLARVQLQDGDTERVNIYPVNNFEYGVLKDFLARDNRLGARRPVFIFHLHKYFMKKFNLAEPPYTDPYKFFDEIIRMNSGV